MSLYAHASIVPFLSISIIGVDVASRIKSSSFTPLSRSLWTAISFSIAAILYFFRGLYLEVFAALSFCRLLNWLNSFKKK